MKRSLLTLFAAAVCIIACSSVDPDVRAVSALAKRVLAHSSGKLEFQKTDAPTDSYRIEAHGRKVRISGNNANSMAVGLNTYLREYCHIEIGWMDREKATLPRPLPLPESPVETQARVPQRFFLNYCTYGYTMPWWHWKDWERLIDWMALNGVNLPLAITGQEAIWYDVWSRMGLTDEEIRSYFSGPAHLPWHRMINIDRWEGPLPQGWIQQQAALQQKIVSRERELNMRPVLPAFSGHVPAALSRVCPEARIRQIAPWAGFDGEYRPSVLDPTDPLFARIQKAFLDAQAARYGTDHIYGIDLFNEIKPESWEPDFLAKAGKGCYESLAAADPEATWLQMTWLFWYQRKDWTQERIRAYITSYPADRSLLLDYYCENIEIYKQTQHYYGVPHLWCYLGNFGGRTGLVGNMPLIDRRLEEALKDDEGLRGIGCTLEALGCNPYIYEYVLSKAWTDRSAESYAELLADSRCSKVDEKAREAWRILVGEVYSKTLPNGFGCVLHQRPSPSLNTRWSHPPYDPARLETALDLLDQVDADTPALHFDRVNLRRQVLCNRAAVLYDRWKEAYDKKDLSGRKRLQAEFLSLMDELDKTLQAEPFFRLDKWIEDARSWGKDAAEKDYYEQNARNILTSWGGRGSRLTDYAARSISGLVDTYYKVRWQMFFDEIDRCESQGVSYEEKAFTEKLKDFEYQWWRVNR